MRSTLGLRDVALGVGVALVWGMGVVFAKGAIATFPPILLMCLRFGLAALLLVWFVPVPRGQMGALFRIALVSAAIQYSLVFTGLKGLDVSVALIVLQLEVPFLTLIGALVLGERAGARKWTGIAAAFAGVALIAGQPSVATAWVSVAMVVSGSIAWAFGQVMVRQLRDIDGLTTIAWVAVMATPQLALASALFETGQVTAIRSAGPEIWATVFYLGIGMTAIGYGMWYSLVRNNPVGQVAPFLLLLPVFGVLGSVIVLGERPDAVTLLGGIIVIAGVGFILHGERITQPEV